MKESSEKLAEWARKYNFREAPSINSCELCSFVKEIDADGLRGVEALVCSAGTKDTGISFPVGFANICDLFMSDLLEEKPVD